jgi:hypothetical protein
MPTPVDWETTRQAIITYLKGKLTTWFIGDTDGQNVENLTEAKYGNVLLPRVNTDSANAVMPKKFTHDVEWPIVFSCRSDSTSGQMKVLGTMLKSIMSALNYHDLGYPYGITNCLSAHISSATPYEDEGIGTYYLIILSTKIRDS